MLVGRNTVSFVFFVIITQSQVCSGQIKRDRYLADYVFKGNHLHFSLTALSTTPAKLTEKVGNYPISTNRSFGVNLGVRYQININNKNSVCVGVESMILGSNVVIAFDKNSFSPALVKDYNIKGKHSYMPAMLFGMPVLLSRRRLATRSFAFVEAGFKGNISTGADISKFVISLKRIDGTNIKGGEILVNANNDRKLWISLILNGGYFWLLRNNNLLGLSLAANLSFSKFVNGNYVMRSGESTTISGTYASKGSYFGVSLSYVFTNANFRIRKAIEKKTRL